MLICYPENRRLRQPSGIEPMARLASEHAGRESLLRLLAHFFRIDPPLLLALLLLCATGLVALYSASGQDLDILVSLECGTGNTGKVGAAD